jgi:hypothetical protein
MTGKPYVGVRAASDLWRTLGPGREMADIVQNGGLPMRRLLPRTLGSVALLSAASAFAADAATYKMPWDGFGVGSYAQHRKTTKMELAMKVPGMPEGGQTTETRQTLVKVTDEAYTVKHETKVGGSWQGTEMTIPRKFDPRLMEMKDKMGAKVEDLGSENLKVDGKEYAAKKTKVEVAGATTVSWTHETLGLLKSEMTSSMGGTAMKTTTEVETFAAKVKVGEKDVVCKKTKTTSKASTGDTTMSHWTSETVPGHQVKSESVMSMPQMKNVTTEELVAYEAKPLEAK